MLKAAIKSLLRYTPYRVVRNQDLNRFNAIEEVLSSLYSRGYRPKVVIDGGANIGDFSRLAKRVFPDAVLHMIEPQPACAKRLQCLADQIGFFFHPIGLSSTENKLTLAIDEGGVTTGAHIVQSKTEQLTCTIVVTTLDKLFCQRISKEDRTLLKLDLQGWELEALLGGVELLKNIEVILIEASFFTQGYEPSIFVLQEFLSRHEFELQDIASITARPRDNRARQLDFLYVKRNSALMADSAWS